MAKKVSSAVIIGSTGFIGKSLFNWLKSRGFNVMGASSKKCNLLDPVAVNQFLSTIPESAAVVFCSVINRCVDDSVVALHKNISMIDNLIKNLHKKTPRCLIYLSSVDVYGRSPLLPVHEETLSDPESYYGLSKHCSEILVKRLSSLDCSVSILRLPGVYGYGDNGKSMVGFLSDRICNGKNVTLFGNGAVLRDYVHVSDVCRVIDRLIRFPQKLTLNIATGISLSMKKIVEIIADVANRKVIIEYGQEDEKSTSDLIFDINKLKHVFPDINFMNFQQGYAYYITRQAVTE